MRLWKLVSEYVRRRDKGVCYTCGDKKDWKDQQCGHYIHKDCLDFEVDFNLRCQCVRCNKWLSGNSGVYAERLIKEIGAEQVGLLRQQSQITKKWSVQELENLIFTYKQALKCFKT